MKKIYSSVLILVLLFSLQLHAQDSKTNIPLYRYINNPSRLGSRSSEQIPLLVKGNINQIRTYVISHGGTFKYSVGTKFSSINLPLSTIQDFSQSNFVIRVEGIYGAAKPMDSVGCHQSNVFQVHNDSAPLKQAYLGDSVVVGIIDGGGFYFRHPDFKQPYDSTKTRFLYIWDQTKIGNPPTGFNYGTEWDSALINAGKCTEVDDPTDFSHGTNALGNAAGNGLAFSPSKAYISAAPRSNIIGVKFKNDQYWLNHVVDGAEYIYSKADSLHEPCVITLSYGTYLGSHDGQDLVTQMLDTLIDEHKGHAFVAACGDGGNLTFHLGYNATSDSLFTWFLSSGTSEAFEFWIDTAQANNFNFAIGVDREINFAGWKDLGRDQFLNIKEFNLSKGIGGYANKFLNSQGKLVFRDTVYAERIGGAYFFEVHIATDSIYYYYRFITKGTGRFDCWSTSNNIIGTWEMGSHADSVYFPKKGTYPDLARYMYPDSFQTICSGIQCSNEVISVANYTNRNNWIECNGTPYSNSNELSGYLAASSSWGPTRDGRIEPDISAPGDETLTPGDSLNTIALLNNSPYKVTKGCVYNRNGGTSMAAPFAAGVAALYFQEYPNATWKDVKAAIDSCALTDGITGSKPISYEWGFGKINAYCAMQHKPDSTSGLDQTKPRNVVLENYPNPFNDYTNIVYNFGTANYRAAEIDVYNMVGQKLNTMILNNSSGSLQFNNNSLPGGMYIYRLVVDQKPLATGKFIVLY